METKKLQNFIDGEWIDSNTPEFGEIRNPARDTPVCQAPMSTKVEIDEAVKAAQDAFQDWRNTPPVARARCL